MTASVVATSIDRDTAVAALAAHAAGRGFAIAFDLLGTRAEAEDAVQEALTRALAQLHRVREPAALEGWYYRVLTNLCIRWLRRRRVVDAFARIVTLRGEPTVRAHDLAPDHARVVAALDALPAMQKTAMVLRYGHGLAIGEIATVLDVGTETVKTHLDRARTRVRTQLGVNDE